jgi:hypothetical protein
MRFNSKRPTSNAPIVGGLPEKFGWLPKHKWEFVARASSKLERKETVIPSASSTSSKKVWIRLHVPLRPLL